LKERNAMRELGFNCDDPYANYKEAIVQLPDIAAYRAAVDSKLTVYETSELMDGSAMRPCATVVLETDSLAD
jgi:hypothetical protein